MAVIYKTTTSGKFKDQISGFAYSVVPAGSNVAGTTWKVALVEYVTDRDGSMASQAPSLPVAVTQGELDVGDLVEWDFNFSGFDANLSNAQKETDLQVFLVAQEPGKLQALQDILQFWGREGVTT